MSLPTSASPLVWAKEEAQAGTLAERSLAVTRGEPGPQQFKKAKDGCTLSCGGLLPSRRADAHVAASKPQCLLYLVVVLAALGLELRASRLLVRHSTT